MSAHLSAHISAHISADLAQSCWTHSLLRGPGQCRPGAVPVTSRFLIAAAAEHALLMIIFLIQSMVPDTQVWVASLGNPTPSMRYTNESPEIHI